MSLLVALLPVFAVKPALGGPTPLLRRHQWAAQLSGRRSWGAPARGNVAWNRKPFQLQLFGDAAAVQNRYGLEHLSAVPFWGALGGVPGGTPPTPLDECPGSTDPPPLGDRQCNLAKHERVCTQLLDDAGEPLSWGENGNFWDITSRRKWLGEETGRMSRNNGDSWCASAWDVANLIEKVGCENVNIRCRATDIGYVMEEIYPDSIKDCLEEKCDPDGTLATRPTILDTPLAAIGCAAIGAASMFCRGPNCNGGALGYVITPNSAYLLSK